MSIRTHSCISVECDVCGYAYDQDEYRTHFADLKEARGHVHGEGWLITSDGRVFCAAEDQDHQAAHDALLPPEPTVVPDGQMAIPLDGDKP